jgi:hypothetical protein
MLVWLSSEEEENFSVLPQELKTIIGFLFFGLGKEASLSPSLADAKAASAPGRIYK